jgi:hypothetical protein
MKKKPPSGLTWSGALGFLSLRSRQVALSRTRIPLSGCTSWRSPSHPEEYWKSCIESDFSRLDGETRAIYSNQWRLRWVNNHFMLKVFIDNSRMAKCLWVGGAPCRLATRSEVEKVGGLRFLANVRLIRFIKGVGLLSHSLSSLLQSEFTG